jgi:hypothetical protein
MRRRKKKQARARRRNFIHLPLPFFAPAGLFAAVQALSGRRQAL